MLEVDAHQGEEGAEGGKEEKVKGLDGQQFLVHVAAAEHLDDIVAAADFVRRFLGLRVPGIYGGERMGRRRRTIKICCMNEEKEI